MSTKKNLLDIFSVSESYKLPDAIMDKLLSDNAENTIRQIKEDTCDDIRDVFQGLEVANKVVNQEEDDESDHK